MNYGLNMKDLFLDLTPVLREQLINTIIALTLILALKFLVSRIIFRKIVDIKARYITQKIINAVSLLLIVVVTGKIWVSGISAAATVIGLLVAGLAVALKEPVSNLAGWLFIIVRRPIDLGDRIQIGTFRGDVIDIRLFQFTLLEIGEWVAGEQSTGRIIHVPNGKIFSEPQINYNQGFSYIWNEIGVLVTFESNWRKTKTILTKILDRSEFQLQSDVETKLHETSKKFMIYYNNLTPIVYTSVKDCGILFSMRYLCDPKKRRTTEELIWEAVLSEFSQHPDIDLAYPTIRYFDNRAEGQKLFVPEQIKP